MEYPVIRIVVKNGVATLKTKRIKMSEFCNGVVIKFVAHDVQHIARGMSVTEQIIKIRFPL